MATLMIRDLDDAAYDRLRVRAEANGHTVEDEARQMLDEQLRSRAAWAAELRGFQEDLRARYGEFPDSTPLIRQMRDEE